MNSLGIADGDNNADGAQDLGTETIGDGAQARAQIPLSTGLYKITGTAVYNYL